MITDCGGHGKLHQIMIVRIASRVTDARIVLNRSTFIAESGTQRPEELPLLSTARIERFGNALVIMASMILIVQMITRILSASAMEQSVSFIVGAYAISLAYLGIFWRSHYLSIKRLSRINNNVAWGTIHLLGWLMLLPFATAWLVATSGPGVPVLVYGFVLTMPMIAAEVLRSSVEASVPIPGGRKTRRSRRGRTSVILCGIAAFGSSVGLISRVGAMSVFGAVAIIQLVRVCSDALA
jgi:uncharacterized membrane protein